MLRRLLGRRLPSLRPYFDESETHSGAYVTSIVGYVASEQVRASLEAAWERELSYYRARTDVLTLHSIDRLAGTGEFSVLMNSFSWP